MFIMDPRASSKNMEEVIVVWRKKIMIKTMGVGGQAWEVDVEEDDAFEEMTHGPGSMSLMTGSRRPLATSPGNVPPRGHGLVMPMDDEELSTTGPILHGCSERA